MRARARALAANSLSVVYCPAPIGHINCILWIDVHAAHIYARSVTICTRIMRTAIKRDNIEAHRDSRDWLGSANGLTLASIALRTHTQTHTRSHTERPLSTFQRQRTTMVMAMAGSHFDQRVSSVYLYLANSHRLLFCLFLIHSHAIVSQFVRSLCACCAFQRPVLRSQRQTTLCVFLSTLRQFLFRVLWNLRSTNNDQMCNA